MAAKPKLTTEQISAAHERHARGETKSAIAAEYGVTDASLGAAMRRHPRVQVMAPPSHAAPPAPDDTDELAPPAPNMSADELRAWYSAVATDCRDNYDRLQVAGETAEARKVLDLGIKAGNALARLTKAEDPSIIKLSAEELEERADRVRRTARAYLATGRPLLCSHCSRQLSADWGDGK